MCDYVPNSRNLGRAFLKEEQLSNQLVKGYQRHHIIPIAVVMKCDIKHTKRYDESWNCLMIAHGGAPIVHYTNHNIYTDKVEQLIELYESRTSMTYLDCARIVANKIRDWYNKKFTELYDGNRWGVERSLNDLAFDMFLSVKTVLNL